MKYRDLWCWNSRKKDLSAINLYLLSIGGRFQILLLVFQHLSIRTLLWCFCGHRVRIKLWNKNNLQGALFKLLAYCCCIKVILRPVYQHKGSTEFLFIASMKYNKYHGLIMMDHDDNIVYVFSKSRKDSNLFVQTA